MLFVRRARSVTHVQEIQHFGEMQIEGSGCARGRSRLVAGKEGHVPTEGQVTWPA